MMIKSITDVELATAAICDHFLAARDEIELARTLSDRARRLVNPEQARDVERIGLELAELWKRIRDRESMREDSHEGIPLSQIRRAVELAEMCKPEDGRVHPFVGAVILRGDVKISEAFRSEDGSGGHAEQLAIEKVRDKVTLDGSTIIATLEPCTERPRAGHRPCAEMILKYGVRRVMIGLVDPNKAIRGNSEVLFRTNSVGVSYFPTDLAKHLWELNRDFYLAQTKEDFRSLFTYRR